MKHFNSKQDCLNYIRMEFPETLRDDADIPADQVADVETLLTGIEILTDSDRDTILAALRLWQRSTSMEWRDADPIASEHDQALSDGEIDDLCERLNS